MFGEIQGLRALAVALVVAFHVWPQIVPGGFVGVDVFFVISGYLITQSLAKAAYQTGTISLREFYTRRVRRLLPAAMLVLIVVGASTVLLLPQARWLDTASHILASAAYVENWLLAAQSTDYLAASNAATPVQHYWSLSVEEQFYLVWPVLMLVAAWAGKRFKLPLRPLFAGVIAVILVASLLASAILSYSDLEPSFFVTHTRMWELAAGGLLALSHAREAAPSWLRGPLLAAGLAAVACAAALFSGDTVYPGLLALVPVLGAVAIILAGPVVFGRFSALDNVAFRWIGDRSYSIYLWHWPILLLYGFYRPELTWLDGVGVVGLTLIVAHLCFTFVEQPFRQPRPTDGWRPLAAGAASVIAVALAVVAFNQAVFTASARGVNPLYPGPAALLLPIAVPSGVPLVPPLTQLKLDTSDVYALGCHQNQTESDVVMCAFGDQDAPVTIAIVGDSHAATWVPALEHIVAEKAWRLLTFTKSSCAYGKVTDDPTCLDWQAQTQKELLRLAPDYAVFAHFNNQGSEVLQQTADNLAAGWKSLQQAGIQILAIADVPDLGFEPGDCLANPSSDCSTSRETALTADPMAGAVAQVSGARLIDLTDALCEASLCRAVVGNIVVYRDPHHLTATYATALAPQLAERAGLGYIAPPPLRNLTEPTALARGVALTITPSPSSLAAIPDDAAAQAPNATPPVHTSPTQAQLDVARSAVGISVRAALRCGKTGDLPQFRRSYAARLQGKELTMLRAEPGSIGYEYWSGTISGDDIVLAGEFIDGDDQLRRPLSFSLTSMDGGRTYAGEGTRDTRHCLLDLGVL